MKKFDETYNKLKRSLSLEAVHIEKPYFMYIGCINVNDAVNHRIVCIELKGELQQMHNDLVFKEVDNTLANSENKYNSLRAIPKSAKAKLISISADTHEHGINVSVFAYKDYEDSDDIYRVKESSELQKLFNSKIFDAYLDSLDQNTIIDNEQYDATSKIVLQRLSAIINNMFKTDPEFKAYIDENARNPQPQMIDYKSIQDKKDYNNLHINNEFLLSDYSTLFKKINASLDETDNSRVNFAFRLQRNRRC